MAKALLLQFKGRQLLAQPVPAELPMLKRAALLELTAGAAMGIYDRSELGKILDDVERIDPNSITALSIRATLAMREGKLDEAAQQVEQLAHIDNNNPTAWLTRASLSHVRDESEQALSEYAKVIELDPDNVEARLARLGLLLDLGRDRDTDSEFEYFDKDVKKKVDPRLAYLAAIKLSRAGKGKEATAKLTDAGNTLEGLGHEIVYHNVQLLMVVGIVNFTVSKDKVARAYLEEYLKLTKGDLVTRKMLAEILLKQRDFGRASKLFEQASEHFGDTPELLALLARAYTGAGNEARATAVLQRAVQLQPANSRLATELALSRARRGKWKPP